MENETNFQIKEAVSQWWIKKSWEKIFFIRGIKSEVFQNYAYIHSRTSKSESSYYYPFPINMSKITKCKGIIINVFNIYGYRDTWFIMIKKLRAILLVSHKIWWYVAHQ